MAEDVDSEESVPRIVHERHKRRNPVVTNPEQYWRVTTTIPLLDSMVTELEIRFSDDKRAHFEFCSLIPTIMLQTYDLEALTDIISNT